MHFNLMHWHGCSRRISTVPNSYISVRVPDGWLGAGPGALYIHEHQSPHDGEYNSANSWIMSQGTCGWWWRRGFYAYVPRGLFSHDSSLLLILQKIDKYYMLKRCVSSIDLYLADSSSPLACRMQGSVLVGKIHLSKSFLKLFSAHY